MKKTKTSFLFAIDTLHALSGKAAAESAQALQPFRSDNADKRRIKSLPLRNVAALRSLRHYDFRVNGRRSRASTEIADKQKAKNIEARERGRILERKHGIRRQVDVTFKAFSDTWLKDHAEPNKRSAERDRYILKVLNRSFGTTLLHEITAHRIEQFKRERLAGKRRGHNTTGAAKPIRPASVNRELDALRSILAKAVEWGKLLESPARNVKRLKVAEPADPYPD